MGRSLIIVAFGLLLGPALGAQGQENAQGKSDEAILQEIKKWGQRPWFASPSGVARIPFNRQISFASFSPDSKRLALILENDLAVVDLATARTQYILPIGETKWFINRQGEPLSWSADGQSLIYGGNKKVVIRKAATGELIKELDMSGNITKTLFSADGKRAIGISNDFDKQATVVRQWTTSDWKAGTDLLLTGISPAWALAADGNELIYKEFPFNAKKQIDAITIVDLANAKTSTIPNTDRFDDLILGPKDGRILGMIRGMNRDSSLVDIDRKTGKTKEIAKIDGFVNTPRLMPDGKTVFYSTYQEWTLSTISYWLDSSTGKEVGTINRAVHERIALSPGGRLIATTGLAFDTAVHFFDSAQVSMPGWTEELDVIKKLRQDGLLVELRGGRLQLTAYMSNDLKARVEAVKKTYPKVKSLTLTQALGNGSGNYLTTFQVVKDLTELEELSTSLVGVTDDSLKEISQLKNLKKLHIEGATKLSSSGLAHLQNIPLKSLRLTNCFGIKAGTWEALSRIQSLENLEIIYQSQVEGDGIEKLANLKNLKSLAIESNGKLTADLCQYLVGMKSLERLELLSMPCSTKHFAEIPKLKSLKVLRLDLNPYEDKRVGDAEISQLKELTNLEELYLDGVRGASIRSIYSLNWDKITHLGLRGIDMNGNDLDFLKNTKNLRYLSLPSMPNGGSYQFDGLKLGKKLEAIQLTYSLFQRQKELLQFAPGVYFVP